MIETIKRFAACATIAVALGAAETTFGVELTHRWSFNGDWTDSVGGADAVKCGSYVSLYGNRVHLGGSYHGNVHGTGYVDLGTNMLDTTAATIEIWKENSPQMHTAELARRTGFHATFAQAIPYQGGGYGVAVLSREDPISVERVPLPGKESRVLLLCEFQDFWFGTMHLDFGAYQLQAVEAVRLVVAEKAASKPVFITGDWNNVPKSNTLAALREFMTVISKEDCCTFHGRTDYPAEKEYCIDYIAVDSAHAPACKVREAYVTKNIVASDHNPIVAVVELERWCAAREGKAISLAKLKWRQRYAQ